jgi:hypothetical protein
MTRDQAIAKIKKCLALAKGGNPHEAATAMRQAQALMAQHGMTDRDMSMIDVREVAAKAVSTAANRWELLLVNVVADAFGCHQFARLQGYYNAAGNYVRTRHYVFVGTDASPTVAGYAFEVLSRQCARARLAHISKQPKNCKPTTKTARGDEFAVGWVFGVEELVERFATGQRDEPLLLAYMQDRHPDLTKDKVRDSAKGRKMDIGHQMAGQRAAKDAQLKQGLGGVEQRRLIA